MLTKTSTTTLANANVRRESVQITSFSVNNRASVNANHISVAHETRDSTLGHVSVNVLTGHIATASKSLITILANVGVPRYTDVHRISFLTQTLVNVGAVQKFYVNFLMFPTPVPASANVHLVKIDARESKWSIHTLVNVNAPHKSVLH